jgi:hypothetical protein
MDYLIKKNPDATVKDWIDALKDIESDRRQDTNTDKKRLDGGGVVSNKANAYFHKWYTGFALLEAS